MIDINKLVRKNIRELTPYASAREQFAGKANIYLDANENPNENGSNRYPDPQQKELKNLISQRNEIATNQIMLGNGSDELLDLIVRVFCEPANDNIIITPPTFGIYRVVAKTNNIEVKEAPLTDDFELDIKVILDLVDDKTKVIFLCSPNNPTGNLLNTESIKKLLKLNCIIVIDEAYIEFTNQESWSKSLDKNPNLIVTKTLSKAWAQAGIRVGISFSSEKITTYLDKIRLPYNLNELSQQRAIEVLSNTSQILQDVEAINKEKAYLLGAYNELKIVQKVYLSDANFFLIKFINAAKVYEQLANQGIITRDFSNVKGCEESLRISVGTPVENKLLIECLQKIK